MPHLQFEVSKKLTKESKVEFINFVQLQFSKIMLTGTDHIAISIREMNTENLNLGRAIKNKAVCLMNLDIRQGRSESQKKELVKTLIKGAESILGVEAKNQYVTITNHTGEEFNFFEKSLTDWKRNDDPANN